MNSRSIFSNFGVLNGDEQNVNKDNKQLLDESVCCSRVGGCQEGEEVKVCYRGKHSLEHILQ